MSCEASSDKIFVSPGPLWSIVRPALRGRGKFAIERKNADRARLIGMSSKPSERAAAAMHSAGIPRAGPAAITASPWAPPTARTQRTLQYLVKYAWHDARWRRCSSGDPAWAARIMMLAGRTRASSRRPS